MSVSVCVYVCVPVCLRTRTLELVRKKESLCVSVSVRASVHVCIQSPPHEVLVKTSKEKQIKVHPVNCSIREMHINQILWDGLLLSQHSRGCHRDLNPSEILTT